MSYIYRFGIICYFIFFIALPASAQATSGYKIYKRKKYTTADSLRGALLPERTCYDVHYYNLSVEILPKQKLITGSNEIHFLVIQSTKIIQVDLFENMKINKIDRKSVV